MITPWGYEIELPQGADFQPLITETQFHYITGNRFADNPSVSLTLAAASQAVRNYCGWHIAPNYTCKAKRPFASVISLPALIVTHVTSVKVDGYSVAVPRWQRFGTIELQGSGCEVEVEYEAGLTGDPLLAQVVAQVASNSLAAPMGVKEEHAGNVGITYNETGSGIAGGVTIMQRDRDMLSAYKVQVSA